MRLVSTFVAILITILVTVSLGLMYYGWMSGYLGGTTETAEQTQEEIAECAKANIDLDFSSIAQGKLNVTMINIGSINLKSNFTIKVEYQDGTIDIQTVNLGGDFVPGNITYLYNLDFTSGTIRKVSVRPLDICSFLEFSKTKTIAI